MTDADCVFCAIVAGEAEALVVDDRDGDREDASAAVTAALGDE
ncbi:hypothetical protein [Halorubellus sp. PRR65]|nr:hypothetical protein [Halorubellus sp. PRR65]